MMSDVNCSLSKKYCFSFTFTIPAFKNIKYKSANCTYGKLSHDQQHDFLENHLQDISSNMFNDIKWIYEFHKNEDGTNGRLHVHGFIKFDYAERVEEFRNKFYSSYRVNMSYKSYVKMSDVQRTLTDIFYFENYMEKHQNEIPYFMSVISEKKHSEALDKGVKIEYNNIGLRPNSLDNTQENNNLPYEKYLFGKLNKFLVEL